MEDLKDDLELCHCVWSQTCSHDLITNFIADEDDAPSSSEYSVSPTSSKSEDEADSEPSSEAEENDQPTAGIENEIEGDFECAPPPFLIENPLNVFTVA
jgi:hypothetical protein